MRYRGGKGLCPTWIVMVVCFHLGLWEEEISPFPSIFSGLGSRRLSIALTAGQSCVPFGKAFFKNSLRENRQLPQADYSKPLTGVSSPISAMT